MSGLTKAVFNERYRFREARIHHPRSGRQNYVNCVSCVNRAGGANDGEGTAYCEHPDRLRRVKVAEYWGPGLRSMPSSHNIANRMVCDGHESQPLPDDVSLPVLNTGQAILIGTQYRGPYHGDSNCSYVAEEARRLGTESPCLKRADIYVTDISDMVPGEVIRDICDMPCCEEALPFQLAYNPNGYRHRVGLPDGSGPRRWVRNGIQRHGTNSDLTTSQAEDFFDLRDVVSGKGLHSGIVAVADHLRLGCNRLGSRPLSQVSNPVRLGNNHHILDDALVGDESGADLWVYDDRLFDMEAGLPRPLAEMEGVPEGILPCMDDKRVLGTASCFGERYYGVRYNLDGILRRVRGGALFDKGIRRRLDIRAVSFHAHSHMWGEFGVGFEGLASFHEE